MSRQTTRHGRETDTPEEGESSVSWRELATRSDSGVLPGWRHDGGAFVIYGAEFSIVDGVSGQLYDQTKLVLTEEWVCAGYDSGSAADREPLPDLERIVAAEVAGRDDLVATRSDIQAQEVTGQYVLPFESCDGSVRRGATVGDG